MVNLRLNFFPGNLKEYFDYEDKLRRIVSKITAILIVVYCLMTGLLVSNVVINSVLNKDTFSLIEYLILFISTPIAGLFFLKSEIKLIALMIDENGMEKYSYLRLLLFISVIVYILLLIFFYSFKIFSLFNL